VNAVVRTEGKSLPNPRRSGAYRKLTVAQQMFVDAMFEPGVGNRAAAMRKARPDLKDPEGAASLIWKKPLVRAAVAEIQADLAERAGITREQLAREYATIGFFSEVEEPVTMDQKLHALDSYSKLMGWMHGDKNVNVNLTLEQLILASREPVAQE